MIICVSGTPGTGKTVVAKALASKLKGTYVDVKQIIKQHKLGNRMDKKRNAAIIDTKKLSRILVEEIKRVEKIREKEEKRKIVYNKRIYTPKYLNAKTNEAAKAKNPIIIIDSHL